ncbi:hypothetical protein ACIQYL_25405 [Lysinibacillus xylanilyticus]|uniref:hypothetical protein n=1 Tax=Lysinibacillus xylanilyticus TaxID=582475 RepID=UPI0037F3917E
MSSNRVIINFTIRIEEDFDNLVAYLRPLQFTLKRSGELVWINPFDTNQQLSIKPMTADSCNYVVIYVGDNNNLSAILNRALGTFENRVVMMQYELYLHNFSISECQKDIEAETAWKQATYNDRIYSLPNAKFTDIACLLMDNKITFMTREIFEIKHVNKAVADCNGYSDIFIKPEPFNLFTYMEDERHSIFTVTA